MPRMSDFHTLLIIENWPEMRGHKDWTEFCFNECYFFYFTHFINSFRFMTNISSVLWLFLALQMYTLFCLAVIIITGVKQKSLISVLVIHQLAIVGRLVIGLANCRLE